MKKRKTFTIMAILLAVLILGVGYAAISNVTLTVNGTANVKADADFNVVYDTSHTVVVSPNANVTMSDETTHPVSAGAYSSTTVATMTVYLDKNNTTATAIYKIDNNSTQLAASLTANVTQVGSPNTNYFGTITSALYSDAACSTPLSGNLAAGSSAYLKVTVPKGTTEPSTDVTGATFTVTITAAPQTAG